MDESKKYNPVPAAQDPLVAQILQSIERHLMLVRGDKVLVGVSGGPDSVALLHLLHMLSPFYALQIGVAHLDHGLRPEGAEQELALVCSLARQLDVPCHTGKIAMPPVGGSLEERLREHRYAFFQKLAADHGYTKTALGHHADDNAEAVLLRLLRGSGLRGMAGIPPVRDGHIIRPLIHTRRAAILAYLERHQLPFALDPSNADERFKRNKIRHYLLPLLQEHFNPSIVQTLNRLAMLCNEEDQWLTSHLQSQLTQIVETCRPGKLELNLEFLLALPRPAQRRMIRASLEWWQGHLRRLGVDHVEAILGLAAGQPSRCLHLPGKIQVRRTSTHLRFATDTLKRGSSDAGTINHFNYVIACPEEMPAALEIPEARCRLIFSTIAASDALKAKPKDSLSILLDMHQIKFPLTIRNRQPGDRLHPFGMTGSQKVKTLLINQKVPIQRRDRLPLLLDRDRILWVVGVRRGNDATISAATRQVLQVTLEAF